MIGRPLVRATRAASWLAALLFGAMSAIAAAQTVEPPAAARTADLGVPTTKILAIGRFRSDATPAIWRPYLAAEVRDTVQLYLAGKIEQWWVKTDQSGVVFLFAASDPREVQALLDRLPLGRAGLMEFELIPVGPLSPLRLLLAEPVK